jgi:hypothetical protein
LSYDTGIAFKDLEQSEGTIKACKKLITHFTSSSQAMAKLLAKQTNPGRELKPIQDVTTRWWSTHSMVERLLRLKMYLAILEDEGELNCNLTEQQWVVCSELQKLLEPFMIVQRLLEGQTYVTISLIPYVIFKLRKNLEELLNSPMSSNHVRAISQKMADKLVQIFGTGVEGTVAVAHLPEGRNRRPVGIQIHTLLASLLDPRFKGRVLES